MGSKTRPMGRGVRFAPPYLKTARYGWLKQPPIGEGGRNALSPHTGILRFTEYLPDPVVFHDVIPVPLVSVGTRRSNGYGVGRVSRPYLKVFPPVSGSSLQKQKGEHLLTLLFTPVIYIPLPAGGNQKQTGVLLVAAGKRTFFRFRSFGGESPLFSLLIHGRDTPLFLVPFYGRELPLLCAIARSTARVYAVRSAWRKNSSDFFSSI